MLETSKTAIIGLKIHKNAQIPPHTGLGRAMLTWKQAIQPMLPSNNQKITKIPLKTRKKRFVSPEITWKLQIWAWKSMEMPKMTWKQPETRPVGPKIAQKCQKNTENCSNLTNLYLTSLTNYQNLLTIWHDGQRVPWNAKKMPKMTKNDPITP